MKEVYIIHNRNYFIVIFVFIATITFSYGSTKKLEARTVGSSDYEELVSLFKEFREFAKPRIINGVPDYTTDAMKEQRQGLKKFQSRLAAIDVSGWPVSQQVDYHIVRADMNELDFQHRVTQPWSRNPTFYILFYLREFAFRQFPDLPLTADGVAKFRMRLKAIPEIFRQAKGNLIEGSGDFADQAMQGLKYASAALRDLEPQLAEHHPDMVPNMKQAYAAVDDFHGWLKENRSKMKLPGGVGKENYNWYLKNVHLLPYTWDECRTILEREYRRAVAFLKLTENKNRKLPMLMLATTEEGYALRWWEAEEELLQFFHEEEFMTVPDFYKPRSPDTETPYWDDPVRARGIREFFEQLSDRDPMQQIIHNYGGHHYDGLLQARDDRPIRGIRRSLDGVSRVRSEGPATGLEEELMVAGLYENRPRGQEIVHIGSAYRAVRGLADLRWHSNEFTYSQAVNFDVEMCPYGWAQKEGYTIWMHKSLTPIMPGNEVSFTMGKVQLEQLMADRAAQLSEKFNLRQFMDEFRAAGMIPIALTRWEMTGLDDEIKKLLR